MRVLFLICLIFTGLSVNAQNPGPDRGHHMKRMERPDFTPEQIAELRVKELTLLLDLDARQQESVRKLELEAATERKEKMAAVKERKKLTDEERFQLMSDRLDKRLSMKRSMKSILDKDQFAKWEETSIARKKRERPMKNRHGRDK